MGDSPIFQTEVVHRLQQLGYLHDAVLAAEEEGSLQLGLVTEPVKKLGKAVVRHLQMVSQLVCSVAPYLYW